MPRKETFEQSIGIMPNEEFFASAEQYREFKKGLIWKDMEKGYTDMRAGILEVVAGLEEIGDIRFYQGCAWLLQKLIVFPDLCIDSIESNEEAQSKIKDKENADG